MKLFDNTLAANERGILRMSVRITATFAVALVASLVCSQAAVAQGSTAELKLEEVTVTARKREESLLEVPISISAVSAEALSQYNIKDLNDLQRITPGFTISETKAPPIPWVARSRYDDDA